MTGRSQLKAADLSTPERLMAATVGVALLAAAIAILVWPPSRHVALAQCRDASAGCIVSVDSDQSTFATALAAIGAVVALVGILGIRFNRFKVAGSELSRDYEDETAGYPEATQTKPQADPPTRQPPSAAFGEDSTADPSAGARVEPKTESGEEAHGEGRAINEAAQITVEIQEGLGESLKAPAPVPIAVTRLTQPMRDVDPSFLRDYQVARKVSQHGFFLTHILGPAKSRGQMYSIAIRLSPHKDQDPWQVKSASFYLGRSWGSRVFEGQRGVDGRFGITTEAWGAFLALCEVEFNDGSRILLDHYCDFDMGSLLPS